jgi:putative transposase
MRWRRTGWLGRLDSNLCISESDSPRLSARGGGIRTSASENRNSPSPSARLHSCSRLLHSSRSAPCTFARARADKASWSSFLKHLKERGLAGVRLIISDACLGLAESAAEFFPDAAWQRCIVHWYRNVFSHVPSTKVREIAAMLKAIHASEDIVAAREKAVRVVEKLAALRLTRAAELVGAAVEETLTYYAFPEEHWRRIRTNNPLERILREIRRRTRVVGAFPDGQSALNLAAARLRHIAGTAWSTKRYLNIGLLKDLQMRGAITA